MDDEFGTVDHGAYLEDWARMLSCDDCTVEFDHDTPYWDAALKVSHHGRFAEFPTPMLLTPGFADSDVPQHI